MIIRADLFPDPHTGEDVYMHLRHGRPGARYIEIVGDTTTFYVGTSFMTVAPMAYVTTDDDLHKVVEDMAHYWNSRVIPIHDRMPDDAVDYNEPYK